ncbi:ABC transporter ATP-binding protein [Actinomarinicola tropica]|uniref:ATP-binding cassette domain-containing protein n=1 Tax=Actinomarinicola tropica TaxID=2789776 RepID=A0A5Q2RA42_9ACTN|nr:ABC transporter ATP-binding protein [Actinomarinicola tropica]QGG93749.1 ATP-binding cassette domain-containing protein [Actinomarinicola tropica]
MTPRPIVTFDGVTKVFGRGSTETRALDSVSLSIDPGELVAVMGPSGCGKSTLLHVAGGLEAPTSGQVVTCGRNLGDASVAELSSLRRNDVGFVFQRLNLIPSLTAVENVMLPLELDGMNRRQARMQSVAALEEVGLSGHLDRYPDDFSGGQQQRIAIARAITGTRKVLFADEPTGALDTLAADSVIDLLSSLARDRGTAILLVTHEPRFTAWADRVVYLRDGSVVDEAVMRSYASAADLASGDHDTVSPA